MTIKEVSFRDFIRGSMPADILMLKDKKSNKQKGLFIKPEYTNMVLEFLKEQEQKRVEQKKKALLDFVGEFGDGKDIANIYHQEIKAKKYE